MTSSPAKPSWSPDVDIILTQQIIQLVINNRSVLYAVPELSNFADNGGNKINQKILQLLKRMEKVVPGCEGIVAAVIEGKKGTKGGAAGGGAGKKRKTYTGSEEEITPKKVRAKKVVKKEEGSSSE